MATSARSRRPVLEAFWRWCRQGWTDAVAGNLTAIELTDQELEPVSSGWTPDQLEQLLWLRFLYEHRPDLT